MGSRYSKLKNPFSRSGSRFQVRKIQIFFAGRVDRFSGCRPQVPRLRPYRRTRPKRACPLAVGRYRAAFLVRIPFISVLPSAHGSKWLPGRTRRARTSRRIMSFHRALSENISRDQRTRDGAPRGLPRVSEEAVENVSRPSPPPPPLACPLARSLACSAASTTTLTSRL